MGPDLMLMTKHSLSDSCLVCCMIAKLQADGGTGSPSTASESNWAADLAAVVGILALVRLVSFAKSSISAADGSCSPKMSVIVMESCWGWRTDLSLQEPTNKQTLAEF